MASYFTGKRLQLEIEEWNRALAAAGSLVRFEYRPRNNYHAVDEYLVDEKGNRPSTGCINVGCGTAKEVSGYAYQRKLELLRMVSKSGVTDGPGCVLD